MSRPVITTKLDQDAFENCSERFQTQHICMLFSRDVTENTPLLPEGSDRGRPDVPRTPDIIPQTHTASFISVGVIIAFVFSAIWLMIEAIMGHQQPVNEAAKQTTITYYAILLIITIVLAIGIGFISPISILDVSTLRPTHSNDKSIPRLSFFTSYGLSYLSNHAYLYVTPLYWPKVMLQCITIIYQVGCPTPETLHLYSVLEFKMEYRK